MQKNDDALSYTALIGVACENERASRSGRGVNHGQGKAKAGGEAPVQDSDLVVLM